MTEHSKTVEIGGEELSIVYDDEEDLVYQRKTDDQLRDEIVGGMDLPYTHSSNTWGFGDTPSVEALQKLADRRDQPVGKVYLTVRHLVSMVKRMEDEWTEYDACELYVTDDLPMLVTNEQTDEAFVLAPRNRR